MDSDDKTLLTKPRKTSFRAASPGFSPALLSTASPPSLFFRCPPASGSETQGRKKTVAMYYSAPGINWDAVVARNKELLTRVVEMLFSLVIGLDEKGMVETLPRATHNYIHRILRPAESALRRLILIA